MAYDCFIECDRSNCNSRVQIPQVGAVPNSWVAVQHSETKLDDKAQLNQERVVSVFCSWKCLFHHVKSLLPKDGEGK